MRDDKNEESEKDKDLGSIVRKNNEMIIRFKELNSDFVRESQHVQKPPENQTEFKQRCKKFIESSMGTYIHIDEDKNRLSKA